jgi:hypothetical protein
MSQLEVLSRKRVSCGDMFWKITLSMLVLPDLCHTTHDEDERREQDAEK